MDKARSTWAVEGEIYMVISQCPWGIGSWGPIDTEGNVYVFGFQGKGLIRKLIFKLSRRKETAGLESLSLLQWGAAAGVD